MPTLTIPIVAAFGPTLSGQAGNVGYTVYDAGGTQRIARTAAGVDEQLDAAGTGGTGTYRARPSLDPSWLPAEVRWDVAGQAQVGASGVIGADFAALRLAGATLDLTQALDDVKAATVGGALHGSWALAFGKQVQDVAAKLLKMFGFNSQSVPLVTFDLDNGSSPSTRTPQ